MLSSKEIARKWEGIAAGKAALPWFKCLLLGMLAGMFIAFGALGSTVAAAGIEGTLGKFIGACVFPTGLILVVMAGAELFTGNCLMAGPASNGKVKWPGVLKNWGLVYLGNMIGAHLMAWLVAGSGFLANESVGSAFYAIAYAKCNLPFGEALLRGVCCNILVCGAVWMASGADSAGGKAACCFFPVMLFVLCGFEHSVANMFYLRLGLLLSSELMLPQTTLSIFNVSIVNMLEVYRNTVHVQSYLLNNLLPVTLGNIIGGAGLAVIYAKVYKE